MSKADIAVVGAGLAGSVLAERLARQGHQVSVFEKSRGSGGRMASGRFGEGAGDLGMPWLESRTAEFGDWLHARAFEGLLEPWKPSIRRFDGQPLQLEVFVVPDRSSALTRRLLHDVWLDTGTRVGGIDSDGQEVELFDDDDQALGVFDWAFVATPAPQAVPLLRAAPKLLQAAQQIETRPCWVVALQCRTSPVPADVFVGDHDCFERVLNDGARPGRQPGLWKVQMRSDWSRQHLEVDKSWVAQQAQAGLEQLLGAPLTVQQSRVHRWLYCRNDDAGLGYGLDADARIGACGDWLQGGDAEGAWRSAMALADAVERL